jgi:hypothetical protein
MKIKLFAFTFFSSILLISCADNTQPDVKAEPTPPTKLEGDALVKRGEYIVTIGGCHDCHSPKNFTEKGPQLDPAKLLSGHPAAMPLPPVHQDALKPGGWILMAPDLTAFVGPWGISYAANLTPDSTTGLGAWTEEVFIKTMRTGKHLGLDNGRPILPPMPWEAIAKMSDEDLSAMYAYLRTLPTVSNKVPEPTPPNEALKAK